MNFRLSAKSDWLRIVEHVKRLPRVRDGKRISYRVKIEEIKNTRSLEQNNRYWALLRAVSEQAPAHMGGVWHSAEVWHKYAASRFIGVEAGPFGHGVPKSSSDLSVGEFGEYMGEVEAWAYTEFDGFNFEWEKAA